MIWHCRATTVGAFNKKICPAQTKIRVGTPDKLTGNALTENAKLFTSLDSARFKLNFYSFF